MRHYNDYENAVFGYLKNYNKLKSRMQDLQIAMRDKQLEIASYGGAKIANYGEPAEGSIADELNDVERKAVHLMAMRHDMSILSDDYRKIDVVIQRLDNALAALGEQNEKIIRMKFIDGYQWEFVADEVGFSDRTCRRVAKKCLKEIAAVMFGNEEKGNFIFLKSKDS